MVQEIDGFKGVMGSREILKSIGYGCLFIMCIGIDQFEKDVCSHCYYRFMACFIMEPQRVYSLLHYI